jgi:signal transduction histidine kinase
VALAIAGAAGVLAIVSVSGGSGVHEWAIAAFVPGYVAAGYLLARHRPDVPFGWLYLLAGIAAGIAGLGAAYCGAALAEGWPAAAWGVWATSWALPLEGALGATAILYFPDGRIERRAWRMAAWAPLALVGASCLLTMVVPGNFVLLHDTSPAVAALRNPAGLQAMARLVGAQKVLKLSVDVVLTLVSVVIAVRFLRAKGLRRRQLKWMALDQVAAPLVIIPIIILAPGLFFPVAVAAHLLDDGILTLTILRWRALGIDVVVRRSVLVAALVGAALGTYAAMVAVVGAVVGGTGPLVSAIAATAAVFAFAPLSTAIRSRVNRLFYGRRDDPYAVIAALLRHLSAASDPEEGVRRLVDTLSEELRLPFVELASASGDLVVVRGSAEQGDEPLSFPLSHHGADVGTLRVGHRRGQSSMSPGEEGLLIEISRQVGAAVHSAVLVQELREARDRLVLAREEERRRLQRDLHDGLGPQLTAVTLKMDAARNRLRRDPDGAEALLTESSADARAAVKDVRRLVYALGDPSLDALGLVAALQDHVERFQRGREDLTLTFTAPTPMAALPPAVEVAAFRIASEALNNAVCHGKAQHCHIDLVTDLALHLVIQDDGTGFSTEWIAGVGIRSMHERAAELGGTCRIGPANSGGTRVTAMIPLPRQQPDPDQRRLD